MREALRLWHKHDPDAATYRALVNMALELGKRDVAKRLCQYTAKKVSTEAVQPAVKSKPASHQAASKEGSTACCEIKTCFSPSS